MIDFTTARPLQNAVDRLGKRTPLGVALSSAELALLPVEIREVSFFSAHVECERILSAMQARLLRAVSLQREKLANGKEITMDRARFIGEMQDELHALGYTPEKPSDIGTIRDLSSAGRLGLIWDMQMAMAFGYANWKASFDPALIEAAPCWELVRLEERVDKRPWLEIWQDHGGKLYDGRMIALCSDPIWIWISEFGVPWPPFRWGSGMGLKKIRWREANALGIPGIDDPQVPPKMDFAEGVQASRKGISPPSEDRLRSEFGDSIRFDQETISFHPTHDPDEQSVSQQLTLRAKAIADDGRDQIERARSEDDAAAYPPGFEAGEFAEEILASTSAVAVGRKQLYHDQWGDYAETIGRLIRTWLPDNVRVATREGHLYAWRPDLIRERLDEIHALSAGFDPRNGVLLGYGQNLADEPFALVRFMIGERVVGGFRAPRGTAKLYAAARAKDFSDATGEAVTIHINGEEVTP